MYYFRHISDSDSRWCYQVIKIREKNYRKRLINVQTIFHFISVFGSPYTKGRFLEVKNGNVEIFQLF